METVGAEEVARDGPVAESPLPSNEKAEAKGF